MGKLRTASERGASGAAAVFVMTWMLLAVGACSVQETAAPPLTGPSELALRIRLDALPDSILQDGLSQSLIQIEATNADGRPARGLPLRLDVVFDGTIQDFGTLSSRTVVTGDDGRARVTYTAPPRPGQPTDTFNVITVRATPIGTDFRGEIARTVDVRLIPPGVILPPNAAPQALFTFTPSAPEVLTNVVFDASTSTDEGVMCGASCTYSWEFGDGSTGTGVFASHQYLLPGTFQVRLTVTDARGASGSIAQPITIGAGVAPTAAFTFSPTNPAVSQTIFFTAEGSRAAPGRQIVSYDWNFGSGATGSGVTTSKSYSTPGTYTVTLTVTDNAGAKATNSQSVTVGATGTGPQAALTVSPTGGTTSTSFFFDASPSSGPSPIIEYRFTFGDGTPEVVGSSPTTTHQYATEGTYTARVTIRDTANRTATTTATVTVGTTGGGVGPQANLQVTPTTGPTTTNFFFDAVASKGPSPIEEYRFTFGDDTPAIFGTSSNTTHRYTAPGTYAATVAVRDTQGRTASTTRQIVVTP